MPPLWCHPRWSTHIGSRDRAGRSVRRFRVERRLQSNLVPHLAAKEPPGFRTFYATVRFAIREISRTRRHLLKSLALCSLSGCLLLLFCLAQSARPFRERRRVEHSHLLERGLVAHVAVAGGHLSQSHPPWWRAILSADIPVRGPESSALPCSDHPHHGR